MTAYTNVQRNHYRLYRPLPAIFLAQDPTIFDFDVTFEFNDGRKIYANKYILETASDTLQTMMSDFWSPENGPIKIEKFKYEDFFGFLQMLYAGTYEISLENVPTMLKIGEYCGIDDFREVCDECLAQMDPTSDNLVQCLEFAEEYSFPQAMASFKACVKFHDFFESDKFLDISKPVLMMIVEGFRHEKQETLLYEAVIKWARHRARESHPKKLITRQALMEDLKEILPHIRFSLLPNHLLHDYASTYFFLASPEHLQSRKINIKITNTKQKELNGTMYDFFGLMEEIEKTYAKACYYSNNHCRFWKWIWFPTIESILTKDENVPWYLVINNTMHVVARRTQFLEETDYLLAELYGDDYFVTGMDKIVATPYKDK